MPPRKQPAATKRRPARGRQGGAWAVVGYLLLLLVALGIWLRAAERPWWDAMVAHGRQMLRSTPAAGSAAPAVSTAPAVAGGASGCGARWPLNVLADAGGARLFSGAAEEATVEELAAVPRPARIDLARRSPAEERVYRVPATLLRYRESEDGAWLAVVADLHDAHITMLIAIPAGRCAGNDDRGALFNELREDVSLRFGTASGHWTDVAPPARVVVTGVGLFDAHAGEAGGARNGLALQPVLDLEVE